MKKLATFLFISLGIFCCQSVLAQTVSLTPSSQQIEENSNFSLDLEISSVTNLFGLAFDLQFDPSLVNFINADEGSFLSSGCQTSLMTAENPVGNLIVGLTRLGADCGGVSGSGNLMTLNFKSLNQVGVNDFSFSDNELCLLSGSSCNYVTGNWQTASLNIGTVAVDTAAPSTPANLTAKAASCSQINLSWNASTDNIGVTGYRLYRNNQQIASTAQTSYVNSGLQAGTTYSYTVAAYDAAGNLGSQSSSVSATTYNKDSGPTGDVTPPTISSISITSITDSSAIVNWRTNESASSQIEYGKTSTYGLETSLDNNLVTSHSVALTGLSAETIYHYRIKSKDSAGNLTSSGDNNFTTTADETIVEPFCGDGSCNNNETCQSCSQDCGSCSATSLPSTNEGKIITTAGSDKIYLVVNNQRRWITSVEVFLSYGLTPNSEITVSQSELEQYQLGPDMTQASLPEGKLVRGRGDYRVYIIKPPFKRHIFNPAVFDMYQHFNWDSIIEVDPEIVSSYITSDLYRSINDYRIYSLEEVDEAQGQAIKHHLNLTAEQFAGKNYSWNQVFIVNDQERDYYETGNDFVN